MKYSVPQLKKKVHQGNVLDATLDLSDYIPENEDILAIAPTKVQGAFFVEDDDTITFELTIKTTLTMACARTLKPVEVPVDVSVEELFTYDEDDEYRQIDGLSIDLLPIIWSNIYLDKPMRVIHPDAEAMDDFKSEETDGFQSEETRKVNPKLKDLKNFKR